MVTQEELRASQQRIAVARKQLETQRALRKQGIQQAVQRKQKITQLQRAEVNIESALERIRRPVGTSDTTFDKVKRQIERELAGKKGTILETQAERRLFEKIISENRDIKRGIYGEKATVGGTEYIVIGASGAEAAYTKEMQKKYGKYVQPVYRGGAGFSEAGVVTTPSWAKPPPTVQEYLNEQVRLGRQPSIVETPREEKGGFVGGFWRTGKEIDVAFEGLPEALAKVPEDVRAGGIKFEQAGGKVGEVQITYPTARRETMVAGETGLITVKQPAIGAAGVAGIVSESIFFTPAAIPVVGGAAVQVGKTLTTRIPTEQEMYRADKPQDLTMKEWNDWVYTTPEGLQYRRSVIEYRRELTEQKKRAAQVAVVGGALIGTGGALFFKKALGKQIVKAPKTRAPVRTIDKPTTIIVEDKVGYLAKETTTTFPRKFMFVDTKGKELARRFPFFGKYVPKPKRVMVQPEIKYLTRVEQEVKIGTEDILAVGKKTVERKLPKTSKLRSQYRERTGVYPTTSLVKQVEIKELKEQMQKQLGKIGAASDDISLGLGGTKTLPKKGEQFVIDVKAGEIAVKPAGQIEKYAIGATRIPFVKKIGDKAFILKEEIKITAETGDYVGKRYAQAIKSQESIGLEFKAPTEKYGTVEIYTRATPDEKLLKIGGKPSKAYKQLLEEKALVTVAPPKTLPSKVSQVQMKISTVETAQPSIVGGTGVTSEFAGLGAYERAEVEEVFKPSITEDVGLKYGTKFKPETKGELMYGFQKKFKDIAVYGFESKPLERTKGGVKEATKILYGLKSAQLSKQQQALGVLLQGVRAKPKAKPQPKTIPKVPVVVPKPSAAKTARLRSALKKIKGQGVDVVVGIGKKKKVVAKNLPHNRAIKRGKTYTDKNKEASFKLRPTGKKPKVKDIPRQLIGGKFRAGKRDALRIVEKRKYRMDTKTETKQIRARRRRKKK